MLQKRDRTARCSIEVYIVGGPSHKKWTATKCKITLKWNIFTAIVLWKGNVSGYLYNKLRQFFCIDGKNYNKPNVDCATILF